MSNKSIFDRERILPTYRWDETDKLSNSEIELRSQTSKLLLDFLAMNRMANIDIAAPPKGIIEPIVTMNVQKRSSAMRKAEALIAQGEIVAPPSSLIPTFMASGHEITGVEDRYMENDHPSQELFAYNRLGKHSWLNKKFGEHCVKAVGFAHPNGEVNMADTPTRIKAHAPTAGLSGARGNHLDEWVVVSTKSPIAFIRENGRQAALISRVTGAVDLTSPQLDQHVTDAIVQLSEYEAVSETQSAAVIGQKAVLLDALHYSDGSEKSPFYPVIQTVYLTQLLK